MHELSIARSLLDVAAARVPPGSRLLEVSVAVGPLQSIDDTALGWSWEGLTSGTQFAGSVVRLQRLQWQLKCRSCGRQFSASRLDERCTCNSDLTIPHGGDELVVDSIEVEFAPPEGAGQSLTEKHHASANH